MKAMMNKRRRGFGLIEVVVILVILAALGWLLFRYSAPDAARPKAATATQADEKPPPDDPPPPKESPK
jgi:type II secretory pathway component PulJ